MGWVHCHISQAPPDARQARPDLPAALAGVIRKLIAKSPDDRYQSAHGLLKDLEGCQRQCAELQAGQPMSSFVIGGHDISERFQVSQQAVRPRGRGRGPPRAFFESASSGPARLLLVGRILGRRQVLAHPRDPQGHREPARQLHRRQVRSAGPQRPLRRPGPDAARAGPAAAGRAGRAPAGVATDAGTGAGRRRAASCSTSSRSWSRWWGRSRRSRSSLRARHRAGSSPSSGSSSRPSRARSTRW